MVRSVCQRSEEESIAFMKGRVINIGVGSNQPANTYRM
jgi:hypothetical protein